MLDKIIPIQGVDMGEQSSDVTVDAICSIYGIPKELVENSSSAEQYNNFMLMLQPKHPPGY
ncbi:hypothetical protein [Salipaludibacillus sp. CF4.18]|uniref:hypothetical protein n=1 Tax=Salipaludibacillus sp. CF4.18 TaxID=3373081 RepID=UPI003EE4D5F3